MKINNLYSKLAVTVFTAASLFTVSCQEDESLIRANDRPIATLAANTISADEGNCAKFTINLSKAIQDAVEFRIEVIGGTAEEGVDFDMDNFDGTSIFEGEFGYIGTIAPYQTSQEFSINTILDADVEGIETIDFKLTSILAAEGYINDLVFTVNLSDFVPTTLDVLLDFDGSITVDGNAYDKCNLDFDIFISDSETSNTDIIHNWDGPCNELLSAGGGSELLDNDTNNWADTCDATYYVWIDLWDASGAPAVTNHEDVPMDLVFTIVTGGVSNDITLSLPSLYRTDDQDSNNGTGGEKLAAKIVIHGNSYIITDNAGNVIN